MFHLTRLLTLFIGLLAPCALFAQSQDYRPGNYAIDPGNSILRVYVGRAGILARMGHNHVIHTRELEGDIALAASPLESTAEFSFPVNSFIVDEESEREMAGDGFESQPGDDAKAGTRNNMLGEAVLDAENFPRIAVTATPLEINETEWTFSLTLLIQDRTVSLTIPARVRQLGQNLAIEADFTLGHEDLGLSRFSAIGGSLRVAEEIEFRLRINAVAF